MVNRSRRSPGIGCAGNAEILLEEFGAAVASAKMPPMPEYEALPDEVVAICKAISAPPRLVAHLTLVHDVARKLVARVHATFPGVKFEDTDVFFGAATHDLGKTVVTQELSQPGNLHEESGAELLKSLGVPERRVRFAVTHGNWTGEPSLQLEDLLVGLADNCWKGKRVPELEGKAVEEIVRVTVRPAWEVFALLDGILEELAADADQRLAWQAQFPV